MNRQNKGIILFLVLASLLIVMILANIILGVMSSQTRLSHHQVNRIKAMYATQGFLNLMMEQLRVGYYTYNATFSSCPSGTPCTFNSDYPTFSRFDTSIIESISVVFCPPNQTCLASCSGDLAQNGFCLQISTNYFSD